MLLRRLPLRYKLSRRFFSTNKTHDLSSSIEEFNKELEDIFGEAPSAGLLDSNSSQFASQETHLSSPEVSETVSGLTHVGNQGEAQMVDVSFKQDTKRTAIASCKFIYDP